EAQSASHRAEVAKARVPEAEAAAKKAAARLEDATRPGGAKAAASPAQADAATVLAPARTPDEGDAPRLGITLRGMRYLDNLELEARVGSAQAGLARARQAAKDAIDRRNALQARAEEAEAAAEDAVA